LRPSEHLRRRQPGEAGTHHHDFHGVLVHRRSPLVVRLCDPDSSRTKALMALLLLIWQTSKSGPA
jgi:hypothetical protein